MDKQRLLQLLTKYHNNTLDYSEKEELDAWFHSLQRPYSISGIEDEEEIKRSMLNEFRHQFPYPETIPVRKSRGKQWMVAAAIVGVFTIGGAVYFMRNKSTGREHSQRVQHTAKQEVAVKDIPAGTNRAVLILEDGSSIDLAASQPGILTEQGGVQVAKVDDSTLKYQLTTPQNLQPVYHTLRTPRGGQYRLALPDGSFVWLNAAAAIRYPTAFTSAERKVAVTGEAYFEVAKDPSKPFMVVVDGKEEVKVLGTHFNVNAYPENGRPTITLLEGAVKVTAGTMNVTLKPGQQSIRMQKAFKVRNANIEQVIAWKLGFLDFDNLPLEIVMQEISRWYDVDIVYEDEPDHAAIFGGRIDKNFPLSKVLKMLEAYGIHAQLNNKQVMISKNNP